MTEPSLFLSLPTRVHGQSLSITGCHVRTYKVRTPVESQYVQPCVQSSPGFGPIAPR